MKKLSVIAGVFLLLLFAFRAISAETSDISRIQNVNYPNNRSPLHVKPYIELPLGTIKAKGWLQEQLWRMAQGMSGHLDQIYEPVMGARNGWKGGDGDVWERGPYWIDGLLPLAYLLDDATLKEKVKPWIEWTLASQKENGYFGPDTDRPSESGLQRDHARDWWPKMVMLKVMQQYYIATGDSRVISFLTRYFKYQLHELPSNPLGKWTFWGEQRGGDNLLVVYWLYNITGDSFLLELGDLIHKQTFDWTGVFLHGDQLYRQQSMHCVNLAQGFKAPIVYYQKSGDKDQLASVYKATEVIRNTIGFPTGLWAGDELIRFGEPTHGSELCTAVEMMYSLENVLEITGDMRWADHLERVAYNALPTQVSDDVSCRQYYQQINQVSITNEFHNFSTPHEGTDNLFGTLSGYPCCTSNFHQGWPKLVQHLWYATADNGLASLVFAPSEVTAKVANGVSVHIIEDTYYPFNERINYRITYPQKEVSSCSFPFHVRIPEWSGTPVVKLNGEVLTLPESHNHTMVISRLWKSNDVLSVEFPAEVKISRWFDRSAVVERGPLVYALKLNEKWEKKVFDSEGARKKYGDWFYQVTTDSKWNYSLKEQNIKPKNIAANFRVTQSETSCSYPWTLKDAPIRIKTTARLLPEWILQNGSAGFIPYYVQNTDRVDANEQEIELIPYGCTTLRITEFPVRR